MNTTSFLIPSFPDSTILITGGTSGVGLATAKRLASSGARRIALAGRNHERGARAVEAVKAVAPDADVHFVAGDANDLAQAQKIVETAASLLGSIHILVNCTADNTRYKPEPLINLPAENIADTLLSVALAPMLMSRLVLPRMKQSNGGVIINIASDAAKVPTPGETVLGAAMSAICVFSRTLAMEAKRFGVRVNALTPSLIEGTPTAAAVQEGGFSAKLFAQVRSMAALGVCMPEDLAETIAFLVSPAAAKITGQVISVNSGISAG